MKKCMPFAIVSAHCAHYNTVLNAQRHENMLQSLQYHGLEVKPCKGVYFGHAEESFLVSLPASDAHLESEPFQKITALAALYEQESVLFCGADRWAALYYVATQKRVELGLMRVLSNWEKPSGSYTLLNNHILVAGE